MSKIDAERFQNNAKNDAQIYDFLNLFVKGEMSRNYLFYNRKRGSEQVKVEKKSIQNPSKNHAQKKHAKSTENEQK